MNITKKIWIPVLILLALVLTMNTFMVFSLYQQQASWREVAEQDYLVFLQEMEAQQNQLTNEFKQRIAALESQLSGHEQVLSDTGQALEQLTKENELIKKKLR